MQELKCVRCGRICQSGETNNPDARPFRRARSGLCPDCAVTNFLLCPELEALRIGLLREGIKTLKNPNIQAQFAEILRVGGSEMNPDEIDWDNVIAQWNLPWPKKYRP